MRHRRIQEEFENKPLEALDALIRSLADVKGKLRATIILLTAYQARKAIVTLPLVHACEGVHSTDLMDRLEL